MSRRISWVGERKEACYPGVNPESVLHAVSKACYCEIKFSIGNVNVTFCSIGFDDDEESLRKRIGAKGNRAAAISGLGS
jgi:hypothetical protein